jgi:hypothetical protein
MDDDLSRVPCRRIVSFCRNLECSGAKLDIPVVVPRACSSSCVRRRCAHERLPT